MVEKILVTGATGFIAGHCILELLAGGYEVRGTVRDPGRTESLRAVLSRHSERAGDIELVQASLTDAQSWQAAVRGCDGVLHIASPVPIEQPKNAQEIVGAAREGAVNVLSAAREQGIRRVVMTSSVSAVAAGHGHRDHVYTSEDWSDIHSPRLTPYELSKTVAERAAWDQAAADGGPELAVINPAFVLGPALESDYGSSLEILVRLMRGDYPLVPRLGFNFVDVRDVAALHRIVYENRDAAGNRYICSNGFRWVVDIARHLRAEFPEYARKLPRREAPNLLVRAIALFDKAVADHVGELGRMRRFDTAPAKALGWRPRSPEEAASDGARSLIRLGVV